MKKEKHPGVGLMTGAMYLLGSLPLGFHHGCAKVLAWLLRRVFHYRENVVMVNLSRSFPEKRPSGSAPAAGNAEESVW